MKKLKTLGPQAANLVTELHERGKPLFSHASAMELHRMVTQPQLIPEAVLERDYCLAWFLIGLSRTRLYKQLVFKGGTALKRCYFGDYRFSEDLDFSLAECALEHPDGCFTLL